MANLLDYVRWRGDLTFAERPFNIVDNLVLAALSNVGLAGVVPSAETGGQTTVVDAARALAGRAPGSAPDQRLVFVPEALVEAMGESARFRNALLSGYVDVTDHGTGTQFAAVTIQLDDGHTYISFRGTDSTITGWREDFTMSFETTQSQMLAVDYLCRRMAENPGPVMVGGHSKGGNLAVYAALHLDQADEARVVGIYTNDGPGFSPDILDGQALSRLSDRTVKIVPEFAVIGRIFDSQAPTYIVASSGRGLVQHDVMTWQVEGESLVERPAISPRAELLNRAVDTWLEGAGPSDRRDFTEGLFDSLAAGGGILLQDVPDHGKGSFESVILSLIRARTKTRNGLRIGWRAAVQALQAADYSGLVRERAAFRALAITACGLLFMSVPDLAVQVLGAFATTVICFYLVFRLGRYFSRFRAEHRLQRRWAGLVLLMAGLVVFGVSHVGTLVAPLNVLLSVALLGNAWASGNRALIRARTLPRRSPVAAFLGLDAVVSLMFGVVAIITVDRSTPFYVFELGQYLLVLGLIKLFLGMRRRVAAEYSGAALAGALSLLGPPPRGGR